MVEPLDKKILLVVTVTDPRYPFENSVVWNIFEENIGKLSGGAHH